MRMRLQLVGIAHSNFRALACGAVSCYPAKWLSAAHPGMISWTKIAAKKPIFPIAHEGVRSFPPLPPS